MSSLNFSNKNKFSIFNNTTDSIKSQRDSTIYTTQSFDVSGFIPSTTRCSTASICYQQKGGIEYGINMGNLGAAAEDHDKNGHMPSDSGAQKCHEI